MVTAGKVIIEVGANTKKAETAFAGIKKAAAAMGIAFAGYQLKRFFEDASRAAKEFESDLANVNSLLGKAHPMYNQYRSDLLKLRKDIPVLELKDYTKGLYNTISAGVEAEGAMEAMDAMAKAAAGGWTDLSGVVDGTTTVLNAYGIAAEDTMHVTDLGLKAVEKGKLTYGEYLDGRRYGGFGQRRVGRPERYYRYRHESPAARAGVRWIARSDYSFNYSQGRTQGIWDRVHKLY